MRRLSSPLLLLLAFLLVACKLGVNPSSQSTDTTGYQDQTLACPGVTNTTAARPESGPVTLTVTGWSSTPSENTLVEKNLKNFMKLHPAIHVSWKPISGNYSDTMRAQILNGKAPDVFYLQPDMTSSYIPTGKLLNLTPYMARDHISATDYNAEQIGLFSCHNDQIYGIPKDWNTLGVFYNQDLFHKAGIPAPRPNWTWDDMRTIAKQLTHTSKTSAIYGATIPPLSSRWLAFLLANGGTVLSSDGTHATFNNAAGVAALSFYASFQKQDHSSIVPSNLIQQSWSGAALQAFGEQKAAMVIEGGWLIPYLKDTYPNLHYGIAPLPTPPGGEKANLIFTNAWAAYSQTRHPEAAWELIEYMTGYTAQKSALAAGFALPSLKILYTQALKDHNLNTQVFINALPYGHVDYYGPQDTFIHERLDLATEDIFLNNNANIQTILNDTAAQINQALASS